MLSKDVMPIHPGEILLEDFLKPMGISITKADETMGLHKDILTQAFAKLNTIYRHEYELLRQSNKYTYSQNGKIELSKVKKLVPPA